MKKPYSFRLDESLVNKVKKIAEADNRKLTAMLENILIIFVKENTAKNGKPKI